jgi:dihydropyrimidine dehydrogenase (NAD+) subunit PreA
MVARAFDAGWAGVFYKTICLQEIKEVSPRFDAIHSNGTRGDFYGFRNMEQLSENPVEMDLDIMKRLKQDYPTKVVVASIMGKDKRRMDKTRKDGRGGWCRCCGVEFLMSADANNRYG